MKDMVKQGHEGKQDVIKNINDKAKELKDKTRKRVWRCFNSNNI